MSEMRNTGKAATFFISSDNPAEEKRFRRQFPIIIYPKRSLDRGSVEGVQDAVVDLFCLAATRQIVGSAGSTFSAVASEISGAPLRIANGRHKRFLPPSLFVKGIILQAAGRRLVSKTRSAARKIMGLLASLIEDRREARLYKHLPATAANSEFFEGYEDVRVHLVCYERLNDWVLGKISLRLCQHVRSEGVHCTLGHVPDPTASINHHICYVNFDSTRTTNTHNTLMITHVDTPPKGELKFLRASISSVEMGACMSTETMNFLVSNGLPSTKLCFINPAHDANMLHRLLMIGVAQRAYADGRKCEDVFLDLASKLSPNDFGFKIMGSGWRSVAEQLRASGFRVELYEKFDLSKYNEMLLSIDYYLYWGFDEGSLGFLDAMAAGVATIVSAQGFHLDARDAATHLFKDEAELHAIFTGIAAKKRRRQNAVRDWNWENYARRHLLMWNLVLARKTGRSLPRHLATRLGEIGLGSDSHSDWS